MLLRIRFALIQFGLRAVCVNSFFINNTELNVSSKLVDNLSDLINFYIDYDIHFHYDERNIHLVAELIRKSEAGVVYTLVLSNYDCEYIKFVRIHSKQVLHVVILDSPINFALYSENPNNVRRRDVVYFVIRNGGIIGDLIQIPELNLFGNVVIVVEDESVTVHKACYSCGTSSGIEEINTLNTSDVKINLQAQSFDNFHQEAFKVAFIDYFPLVWCEEVGENILIEDNEYKFCRDVKGTDYKLVQVLAEKLNFTLIPVVRADDYVEVINDTGRGLFDVAMGGITVTASRYKLATFTTIYWYEGYNCLFFLQKKGIWSEMFSFLQPLPGILWIGFLCSCIGVVLTLYLIGKFKRYKDSRLSGFGILWFGMYFLVDQQVPLKQLSRLQKRSFVLLCAWCLVCLNMNTAYKSKLLSTLLNPSHREPQTLMELLDEGYVFVTNTNYADVVISYLSGGQSNNKYQAELSHPVLINTVCDEFDYAATHMAAVIDEYTSLQYEVRNTCHERLDKHKEGLEYVRISKSLKMFGHGWALRQRAPFEDAFNRIIYRIVSAGLILKWRQDVTRGMDNNKTVFRQSQAHVKEEKGNHHVGLRALVSPFFVYLMGNLFALVAFISEIVFYKKI